MNGVVVTELGTRADPAVDVVALDGERIAKAGPRRTVMLHKPRLVVSTMSDPENRPTVREYLPPALGRLYPVGRLDFQSTGLLLLTNDGELAERLLHPRGGVERVYQVKVDGAVDGRALGRLRRGARLEDGRVTPTRVERVEALPTKTWLEIAVTEGRQHLVRRLCAAQGLKVDKLVRVGLGPLALGELPRGAWRELGGRELAQLYAAVKLKPPVVAAPVAPPPRAPSTRPRTSPAKPGSPPPRGRHGATSRPRGATGQTPRPRGGRPRS